MSVEVGLSIEERFDRIERAIGQLAAPMLGPVTRQRGPELAEIADAWAREQAATAAAEAAGDPHGRRYRGGGWNG